MKVDEGCELLRCCAVDVDVVPVIRSAESLLLKASPRSCVAGLLCLWLRYPDVVGECHNLQFAVEVFGSYKDT